jgi:hypothetical protein
VKRNRNTKKISGIPGQTKKISGTPGSTQKMWSTQASVQKTPGSSGSIKKIVGIKKTLASPGSGSPLVLAQSSTSVASSVSGRAQSPYPQSRKLSEGLRKLGTKSFPQPTNKLVSPRFVSTTKKLANVPPLNVVLHTPGNLSTGSSSSASSASSTKAQKLINAVRRVSRMSPAGSPTSKPS